MTESVGNKLFQLNGVNPGCGGTEYVSVLLGINLAKTMPDYQIILVNNTNFDIEECPDNLKIELTRTVETIFLNDIGDESVYYILTASILKKIDSNFFNNVKNKIVCWIHHPFDYSWKLKKLDFYAYVCTGNYQWYSNKLFYKNIWFIQAHFISAMQTNQQKKEFKNILNGRFEKLQLVHLGTLLPSKGFLYIAKSWNNIKKMYPGITLHVIGGISTYGISETHKLIPTHKEFGDEILKYISEEDIADKKIVFHGNLGNAKSEIIKNSIAAIQNPTGNTEAFPESPLECMAFGVPVIASDDFGMGDSMRFFPELILRDPSEIMEKLEVILKNKGLYSELSARAFLVAEYFEKNKDEIDLRWSRLLSISRDKSIKNFKIGNSEPTAVFYGNRNLLRWRGFICKTKLHIRKVFANV